MLVAASCYNLLLVNFYVCDDSFGLYLMDLLETLQIFIYWPDLYQTITTAAGKDIALFDGVQCSDPAGMCLLFFEDWFFLFMWPQENSSILGSC